MRCSEYDFVIIIMLLYDYIVIIAITILGIKWFEYHDNNVVNSK